MSDAPLLGRHDWVIERSALGIELIGFTAGPAGSHTAALDEIEIDIDAATPAIPNRVLVSDPSLVQRAAGTALLVRLVGEHVASEVAEMLVEGGTRRRISDRSTSGQSSVDGRFAALAAAMSAAGEPGRTATEEALSLLEAHERVDELGLSPWATDLTATAERAAVWIATDDEALEASPAAEASAALLRRAADRFPAAAAGLRRAASLLRLSIAPPSAASEAATDLRVTFSRDSVPLLVGGPSPSLRRVSNDEHELRIPAWGRRVDGWWARVFVGEELVPVAAAPMMVDEDDAVATMLLPQLDDVEFVVDIVEDLTTRRASAPVAAFRAALATGRRAATNERLGDFGRARQLWHESAELHDEAGDETRAKQATAIADGELAGSRAIERQAFGPLVSDRLGPMHT